jgi:hypothetical protein
LRCPKSKPRLHPASAPAPAIAGGRPSPDSAIHRSWPSPTPTLSRACSRAPAAPLHSWLNLASTAWGAEPIRWRMGWRQGCAHLLLHLLRREQVPLAYQLRASRTGPPLGAGLCAPLGTGLGAALGALLSAGPGAADGRTTRRWSVHHGREQAWALASCDAVGGATVCAASWSRGCAAGAGDGRPPGIAGARAGRRGCGCGSILGTSGAFVRFNLDPRARKENRGG